MATFDDFMKLDIRVGTIVEAKVFEKAKKPAYQLMVDFGEEIGIKKGDFYLAYYVEENTLNFADEFVEETVKKLSGITKEPAYGKIENPYEKLKLQ